MQLIVCDMQMFSNNQLVQIVDSKTGPIFCQQVNINDLPLVICALAKERDIKEVRLRGGRFAETWVEEIRDLNELKYGSNYMNIEVI